MEEATLRAKIQAMKNLLEVKRQHKDGSITACVSRGYTRSSYGRHQSKTYAPANRSWNRFSPPAVVVNPSHVGAGSTNKVWRREDAPTATMALAISPSKSESVKNACGMKAKNKVWKRPMKVIANKSKSMQLQVLRLEDGEYSKANGGFSLVRAGLKKSRIGPHSDKAAALMPVSHANNNSVHIGGVKYVVANGGKVLRRCSAEECRMTAMYRPGSRNLTTKSRAARAVLCRAKATMQRARSKRVHTTKEAVKARTVYCSFYNRFGFCKNKDACRFIHDSRRVAMCRRFLKNECNDPKCLLSHQHDENKVPDCKLFLRGACTRDCCKYRHVKVSATEKVCEPFTEGYCVKGGACPLRHELPLIKRKLSTSSIAEQKRSSVSTPVVSGTLSSPSSASPGATSASTLSSSDSASPKDDKTELSIRPNIRFASKHSANFPSLFDRLRRTAK